MIRINKELLDHLMRISRDNTNIIQEILPKNTRLFRMSERSHHVFIIREGVVKCFHSQDNGKDFVQEFFSTGEIFGEVEVFTHDPSFSHIETLTELDTFKISHENFRKLFKKDPVFAELITTALAKKIRYTSLRHAYNQSHTAQENLARLIESFPNILDQISKKDIASYLGIEMRSLNRILNSMKD